MKLEPSRRERFGPVKAVIAQFACPVDKHCQILPISSETEPDDIHPDKSSFEKYCTGKIFSVVLRELRMIMKIDDCKHLYTAPYAAL
jgi:hypothetical protein